jgi:hypothetical protein
LPSSAWLFLALPSSAWLFLALPSSAWLFLALPSSACLMTSSLMLGEGSWTLLWARASLEVS